MGSNMGKIVSVLVVSACVALIAGCAIFHPVNQQNSYQQKREQNRAGD
jgi:hypothetical protein